jgi:hypothetical protein
MTLEEFGRRFQALLDQRPKREIPGDTGQKLLEDLLKDPLWLGRFLQQYIADPAFLTVPSPTIFDNEIKLFRSPDKSFILLCYLWDSRQLSPIHDHGAWGIIGPVLHPLREIKYQRLDDDRIEGYAELKQVSDTVINPGKTGIVLPLNKGIHQTGAVDDRLTIAVGLYGRSSRRGYINFFHPAEKKVIRAFRQVFFQKTLALRALALIGESAGRNLLTEALLDSLPDDLIRGFREVS